ncbi:glycosyl transferase [Sorangium cellulosum]|uniref:Glycosyl transferase n=1 Tax=Sorangium cellulosum TaxID=56 RepID=A0A2L0F023_SORCE|nr:glycosyltransferase family 2 protein [Sorangium cellulosum]AUX44885.1 glycosyl transferase [Sorangium cellulosum]
MTSHDSHPANTAAHAARPTTALVLETNNLRGTSDPARVVASLERLLRHLSAQSFPLGDLRELVITHDGLDERDEARLEAAAGRSVRFVRLADDTGYYEAKNQGFDATTADVVAFGDADCWPDPAWLERLFAPFFADPATGVVAGRTTYRDDLLGIAATSIDFMYFPSPLGEGTTRNFYANNVAFRRDVFAARRYRPADGIYRGHCQILGMRLEADGVPIRFEPRAHTTHRFPDGARELFRLRLLRGADTVEITPHLGRAFLPSEWRWLSRLGPVSPLLVLAVRLGFSARAVGRQGLSDTRGARRAAGMAIMGGIAAADAVGALARAAAGADFGVHDGGFKRGALSYHGNGDRLSVAG